MLFWFSKLREHAEIVEWKLSKELRKFLERKRRILDKEIFLQGF